MKPFDDTSKKPTNPPTASLPDPSARLEHLDAFLANFPPPSLPDHLAELGLDDLLEHDRTLAAAIVRLHEIHALQKAKHAYYKSLADAIQASHCYAMIKKYTPLNECKDLIRTNPDYAAAIQKAEDHEHKATKAAARLKSYKTVHGVLLRELSRRGIVSDRTD